MTVDVVVLDRASLELRGRVAQEGELVHEALRDGLSDLRSYSRAVAGLLS